MQASFSASLADGEALPSWLQFDAATQTFVGVPGNEYVGNLTIRVTATNAQGSASAEFTLAVANVNDAPTVANPLGDLQATEAEPFAYTVPADTFADVDAGDTLSWSGTLSNGDPLPVWLTFDAATRAFSGTPSAGDAGNLAVKVNVTDAAGAGASAGFTLIVAPTPVWTQAGTAADDALYAPLSGRVEFKGEAGNDLLVGAGGNDRLEGGADDDRLYGNGGDDTLLGGDGADTLYGWEGDDSLEGGIGNDLLYGDQGDDTVRGDDGDDTLNGWTGNDWLYGDAGNDVIRADDGNDLAVGGDGSDALFGWAGSDIVQGGAGWDYMEGGEGNDALTGGTEGDTLIGGAGNDLVAGGEGDDALNLGAGADIVAFRLGDGADWVNAPAVGDGLGEQDDTLSLSGVRYATLLLAREGNDLLVKAAGSTDSIRYADWYSAAGNQTTTTLQLIVDSTADYDAASTDPLVNRRVVQLNFTALVNAFNTAYNANPALGDWAIPAATLAGAFVAGSDTQALGGDLAYRYGRDGTLAGLDFATASAVLADAGFATTLQSIGSGPTAGGVRLMGLTNLDPGTKLAAGGDESEGAVGIDARAAAAAVNRDAIPQPSSSGWWSAPASAPFEVLTQDHLDAALAQFDARAGRSPAPGFARSDARLAAAGGAFTPVATVGESNLDPSETAIAARWQSIDAAFDVKRPARSLDLLGGEEHFFETARLDAIALLSVPAVRGRAPHAAQSLR